MGWHVVVNHNPYDRTKPALAHALLHGFQQVRGFQFLDDHIGIAGDVKWVRFHDFHSWEELIQVCSDDLFQPYKIMMGWRSAVLAGAAG